MKLIEECVLRDVRGKKVLLLFGEADSRYLEVNDTFAQVWEHVAEREFTEADIARFLADTFELDEEKAAEEAAGIIALWDSYHLLQR